MRQKWEVPGCSNCGEFLTLRRSELVCTKCKRPDKGLLDVSMDLDVSRSTLHRLMCSLGIEALKVSRYKILSYIQQRALETRVRSGDDWVASLDGRVFVVTSLLSKLLGYRKRWLNMLGQGEKPDVRSVVFRKKRYSDLDSLTDYLRGLRDNPGRATRFTPKVTPLGLGFRVEAPRRRRQGDGLARDPLGSIQ